MKRIIASIAVVMAFVVGILIYNNSNVLRGTDELIEKAREIIPVSEADTIDIAYAGTVGNGDKAIIWFISGNEYQSHYYLPMECKIVGNKASEYKFERIYKPRNVVDDIAYILWNHSYVFLINNENCKAVEFIDGEGIVKERIEKGAYPYIITYAPKSSHFEFNFIDENGNKFGR